jgi:hypothetical protein
MILQGLLSIHSIFLWSTYQVVQKFPGHLFCFSLDDGFFCCYYKHVEIILTLKLTREMRF